MQSMPIAIPIPMMGQAKITREQDAEKIVNDLSVPCKNITTSPATERHYLALAKRLIARVYNDTGNTSPRAIANWFKIQSPSWSHATIRQHRSAINYYFMSIETGDNCDEIELATDALSKIKKQKENIRKPKTIPQKKLLAFINHLSESHSKSDSFLSDFLMATCQTGLRPCEWKSASYEIISPTEINLTVLNGKNTNGRALGKSRTMNLTGMVAPIIKVIDEVRRLLQNESWEIVYGRLRRNCYNKRQDFFKEKSNLSLYSGRHQFSANAKNLYLKNAIAMLHGHASSETATSHYGKRVSGWGQFKVMQVLVPHEPQHQPKNHLA
jgi:hypothetical protein